jgi:hypothetical protein
MTVRVLVGTEKGAWVATSNGDRTRWEISGPLFKGWKVTAAHRLEDGTFLVGTGSWVYGAQIHRGKALDALEPVADGPAFPAESGRKLGQIWTLTSGHGRVWAGVDEAALFSSDDAGASWQLVEGLERHPTRASWTPGAGGLCAHVVLLDPDDARKVWCGISAVGVFRSEDGGESWTPRNEGVVIAVEDETQDGIGYCVHGLAQAPDDPARIWRQDHRGMYRTENGGDRWEQIESGLPSGFGFPIAQDPGTRRLFALPLESDEYRILPDGALRMYVSDNGGDSWEPRDRGLPGEHQYNGVLRGALAVDGLDPCGVYFGTTGGAVHVSADRGESWTALPCSLPRILSVQTFIDE